MNCCTITLDVDWAPDAAIDDVAATLVEHGVPATWFVTHASPALERLRERPDLFELGIHPNLLPGSTHGANSESVLEHCLGLVPEARAMRTHGLVQSAALLRLVAERTPIEADLSLYLPRAERLSPVDYEYGEHVLTRLPYLWEDDSELLRATPRWDVAALADRDEGLRIFDFHPIHVFLNSCSLDAYERLKARVGSLPEASRDDLAVATQVGDGVRDAFSTLVRRLAESGSAATVRDVLAEWRARRPALA